MNCRHLTGQALRGLAVVVALSAAPSRAAEPPPLPTLGVEQLRPMLAELKAGGHVFYFRHGLTRQDQEDRQPIVREDCATQRNLSDDGRRQATAIGAAFRKLGIPVGQVLSSPFCRALETSRLAFGGATASDDLYFAIGLPKPEREAKGAALRKLLAHVPASGRNDVIVAHTANLEEAVGFWPKPEGAAILFRPDGNEGFRVVGRVEAETWTALAGGAGKP